MEPYDIKNVPSSGCGGKVFVATILALLIGFGGGWYWFRPSPIVDEEMISEEEELGLGSDTFSGETVSLPLAAVSLPQSLGGNVISVSDQLAGSNVKVVSVTLAQGGWVVIHEDNGGKPGKILGARRFNAGTRSGEVELLRGITAGGTYYAMLHGDNGDRQFNHLTDLPLMDGAGSPVTAKFMGR